MTIRNWLAPLAAALCTAGVAYLFLASTETPDTTKGRIIAEKMTQVAPTVPSALTFAGEAVPLQQPDVRERLERELLIGTYYHSYTILTMKRGGRWEKTIRGILKEQGVPADFYYLMVAESALRNVTSPAGAQGFWQFMPQTARAYGLWLDETVDQRNDPIASTYAACRYLKDMHARFGNWTLVAAGYNMGAEGVAKFQGEQREKDYYNLFLYTETQRYLFRILAAKIILEQPEEYGFKLFATDYYAPTPCKGYEVKAPIASLAEWAQQHGSNYKTLRVLNPWLRSHKLNVPPGRNYTLYVPAPADQATAQVGAVVTE